MGWDVQNLLPPRIDLGLRQVGSERTSAAMQATKRQGKHMGRVSALPPSTGKRLLALRATHVETATHLNAEGFTTATGAPWSANTVAKAQKRLTAKETEAALSV